MNDSLFNAPTTRREALRRTVLFSTALLAPGLFGRASARAATTNFPANGLHLLALGDQGTGKPAQIEVANQMAAFAKKLNSPLQAVLALGDNFYGEPTDENFQKLYEEMYPVDSLNCPFYACLGNHDYYKGKTFDGRAKAQAQLDYSTNHPESRWKLPAKWYAVELPDPSAPLVKLISIDTDYFEGALTEEEKIAQEIFIQEELSKPTKAPWTWVMGHHPFFSNGDHGDTKELINRFGKHFQSPQISMYLSGHDHTLQHLQLEEYNPSFVVSGGGGQDLYKVTASDRSPYANRIFGFNHIHVTRELFEVQFIGAEGSRLHAFRRDLSGKVEVL